MELAGINSPATALVAGVVTSLHCAGMCGPLACGLMPVRGERVDGSTVATVYHLARLAGYAALGAAAGGLGRVPLGWISSPALRWVPWIGVMAVGYAFGGWLLLSPPERRRRLVLAGAAGVGLFVLLRATGLYGDPRPWAPQSPGNNSLYSFLSCAKYPPSLCYLLMTLGPALLLVAWWDIRHPAWTAPLVTFGRVPMFFYLLHLPLLHGLSLAVSLVTWGRAEWLFGFPGATAPAGVGTGLVGVYLAWLAALALLHLACRWFEVLKRRRKDAWLAYL